MGNAKHRNRWATLKTSRDLATAYLLNADSGDFLPNLAPRFLEVYL